MNSEHKEGKIKQKIHKIEEKIDIKLLLFKIFDDPRPKYIAKVTIIDKAINAVFLWMFPQSVRPNYVTLFRFITVPFIIYFVFSESYTLATILFAVSALSDAIDGAIARTRDKITDWGIVFDPFADKLLIGGVGGILIFKFLDPVLAISIILIELILIFSAYYRFKGEIVPAKVVGKLKMDFQCLGVGFIFLFLVFGSPILLILATYILYLAVLFGLLSLTIYRSI